jgi:proteasome lid subunit RPN8/RPN11
VLVAGPGRRLALSFLRNHAGGPGSFLLQRGEVMEEARRVQARGKCVVGVFHSHPVSHATLGPADRRGATANSLHLVYDVCGCEAMLWRVYRRAGRKRVTAMPLKVVRRRP